jgi:3-oxoacyl-[acyl-carrier protein] reductase
MDDSKRVLLITGAGSGMGRATAELFVAKGWRVGALDAVEESVQTLADRAGEAVFPLLADVTDRGSVETAVGQLLARFGPIGVCVNAAGVYPPSAFETADEALYRRIFDVNVLGTLIVSQAAARVMSDGGSIVNFASADAFVPKPQQILYGASKAAIVHLTRSMAMSLAERRIRVNAIAPGPVATEGMLGTPRLRQVISLVPLGRVARPEEMAALVWWLATEPAAGFITGETVVASGGLVMR